jgi:hypothetical protein
MFFVLLIITFLVALTVSFVVVWIFARPIDGILKRIIADEISSAWLKYIKFAIHVVGVSKGVRVLKRLFLQELLGRVSTASFIRGFPLLVGYKKILQTCL